MEVVKLNKSLDVKPHISYHLMIFKVEGAIAAHQDAKGLEGKQKTYASHQQAVKDKLKQKIHYNHYSTSVYRAVFILRFLN